MTGISLSGITFVWDTLAGLIRGYEAQRRDLFTSHVEPLQQRMLTIHKDYVAGFQEVERLLSNRETPPARVIEFLEQRRRDYLADRDLADKVADQLSATERRIVRNDVWSALQSYCKAVTAYFTSASGVAGISWYSDFLNGVKSRVRLGLPDVWETSAISGNARLDLLNQVKDLIDNDLPRALSPINTYYAILRSKLL